MNLHERLAAYVRLFGKRPDIHLWHSDWGTPTAVPTLPSGEMEALFGRSTLRFAWSLERPYGEQPQGDGGHLFLSAEHESEWQSSDRRWLDGVSSSLLVDRMVDEGLGLLVVEEGHDLAQAKVAFFDANDDRLIRFEGLEAYLTLGARRGFAWYWQNDDNSEWPDLLARLREGSIDAGTSADALIAALCGQGATDAEARALVEWLGDDARILVPVANGQASSPA